MIPSQRLRSCLRCWNVSKDELKERERELFGRKIHLFHRSFTRRDEKGGDGKSYQRGRDIFGPLSKWRFVDLLIFNSSR